MVSLAIRFLQSFKNIVGSFQERFGKPGKSCDMDTVASVCAAWNDAAEEHDILSALLHCYRIILDLAAAI